MIDYNIIQAINYFRAEAVNRSYVYKKSTGEFVFLPKKIFTTYKFVCSTANYNRVVKLLSEKNGRWSISANRSDALAHRLRS